MAMKVGDRIRDNDPRTGGRVVTLTGVGSVNGVDYVTYKAGTRKARIRLDRVYPFGSKRKTGWSRADNVSLSHSAQAETRQETGHHYDSQGYCDNPGRGY